MGLFSGRKLVSGLLIISFVLFLSPAIVWLAVWAGLFGPLPGAEVLSDIQNSQASVVYSADDQLLGKYYLYDRTSVSYDDLPEHVVNALIATEDARFFEHRGVDYQSLARVFFRTIVMQDASGGGGSTISQQLVKNLFPRRSFGFFTVPVNKCREMIIASRLEALYSKKEIISLYLNTVPFGDHVFGIESAARRFFNKSSGELAADEAAVLIGMLKGNYTYNPRVFPERALYRRNVVLAQMNKYGYLSDSGLAELKQKPLLLDYTKLSVHDGLATYFREHLRQELDVWCQRHTKADGSSYNLYTDGLRIFTTIDAGMQQAAEQAMEKHMAALQAAYEKEWGNQAPWLKDEALFEAEVQRSPAYRRLMGAGLTPQQIHDSMSVKHTMELFEWGGLKSAEASAYDSIRHYLKFLQIGFVALDPRSGAVKAWVGGINHQYFQFDHVNQSARRQAGSTFKPLVYAAALEQGIGPCDYFPAQQVTYENMEGWAPQNADNNYEGWYTLKGALSRSVNTVSVKVLEAAGIPSVVELARNLGLQGSLPEVPSLALGSAEVSAIELAGAYAAFLNQGRPATPQWLLRIEDRHGNLLESYAPSENDAVMAPATASVMLDMMQEVAKSGTASRLRTQYRLPNALAGKTGTTQNNQDGWFVGMLPELVTVTWVGADNPRNYFKSTKLGQGASSALPIFAFFLENLNQDHRYRPLTRGQFIAPDDQVLTQIDCESFKEKRGLIRELFSKKEEQLRDFGEKKKKGLFSKLKGLFDKKENE